MRVCPSPEALLAHSQWLHRLVRGLVRDRHEVDDVVQQTWLQALLRPPARPEEARPWLARVARNVARKRQRDDRRRGERESRRATSAPTTAESPASIVARAGLHRAVVDAVLALPEPYRTTVLQRFFDGLPPRTIARRQRCSVETVRSRIQRGLARLRGRLEGRGIRAPALLALVRGSPVAPPAGLAAAVAILLASLAIAVSGLGFLAPSRPPGLPTGHAGSARVGAGSTRPLQNGPHRSPVRSAGLGIGRASVSTGTVAGIVRDRNGNPLAGATVVLLDPDRDPRGDRRSAVLRALDELVIEPGPSGHRTTTDARGGFRFTEVAPGNRWTMAAVHPAGGVAVRTGLPVQPGMEVGAHDANALELEGGEAVSGQVHDGTGLPVRGARILLHGFRGERASPIAEVVSDRAGHFKTPPLRFDRLAISVTASGYRSVVMAAYPGRGAAVVLEGVDVHGGRIVVPDHRDLAELLAGRGWGPDVVTAMLAQLTVRDGAGVGEVRDGHRYSFPRRPRGAVTLGIGFSSLATAPALGGTPDLVVDRARVPEAPPAYPLWIRTSGDAEVPASGAELRWIRTADERLPVVLEGALTLSDPDAPVGVLIAGRYRLRLTRRGWLPVERDVDLSGPRRVTLPRGRRAFGLTGRVATAGALVEVLHADRRVLATTRANRHGMFELSDLPPGTYHLVATAERGPWELATAARIQVPSASQVSLVEPDRAEVVFHSPGDAGPFWIRIADAAGFPLHDDRRQGRDKAGNRFFYELPAGARYEVSFETADGRRGSRRFTARPGTEITIDIEEER